MSTRRPIGAHVPVSGGLATAGLRYAAGVPFVVETPGDEQGQAKDIATLRALRDATGPGRAAESNAGTPRRR